ncbi:tetratricopeptide repeat protein [Streptomyces sp. NPDC014864]|uniref:tetratricopeptide repeat protein n=1 Tax=Streptomyces sp. NPDC014864 TaxID=3364924 RepID=UPI003702B04D
MSRLSREKKRELKRAARAAAPAATPISVHVPADGAGASVGGVPVRNAAGEEIQHAVLNHLHRLALATGHPVLATVTDERIGYVVPLRVQSDGSSDFTAEPLRTTPPQPPRPPRPVSTTAAPEPAAPYEGAAPPVPSSGSAEPSGAPGPSPEEPESEPVTDAPRSSADRRTHLLRKVPEPVRESAPTFPLRAVPEPRGETPPTFPLRAVPEPQPSAGPAPTFPLRAIPEPADLPDSGTSATPGDRSAFGAVTPGTVSAPTGQFGPPPVMDARPTAAPGPAPASAPTSAVAPARTPPAKPSTREPAPAPVAQPERVPVPELESAPEAVSEAEIASEPEPVAASEPEPEPEPDPKPTPARGFDAVAEAVLGDDPRTATGEGGTVLLAEPMARINGAVKSGRIEEAATLAERTVTEASATLGPEHAEVLRLRELTAYIAYLATDPVRSFGLSLELARIRRRAGDAEAAYGNVQSAAAAWRAVRDPEQGLRLGRDLIGLWTELTAEEGPAADDIEQLESARARMGRLAERAGRAAPPAR